MTQRPVYLPASVLQRVGSWLVDGLAFTCLVLVPSSLIDWWFGPDRPRECTIPGVAESCTWTPEALLFSRVSFWAIWTVWVLVYAFAIARSASWGKHATQIIVVDAETVRPISYGRAVLRTVLSFVSVAAFGLGLLVAFTNRDRRALHDYIMRTRVIAP